MKKDLLEGLTEEQIAKIKACKSQEEMLELAKQEGIELNDEQLEAVSGGGCTSGCPDCGCRQKNYFDNGATRNYYCAKCGKFLYSTQSDRAGR